MENASIYFRRFLIWRVKHISQKNFILILSLITGLLSGLAAVLLKNTIHFTHHLLTGQFHIENINFLYLAYPVIGIFITVLFSRQIIKDSLGHGISKILYSLSKGSGKLKRHNNFSSIIASTFTIGFGGSVGAEAPIVLTGASIGSTLGRLFHQNYKTISLLIGCGAAGAVSGIFKAPMAGLVFTLEVLMLGLSMASLVPLLISAFSAATVAYLFLGEAAEFSWELENQFVLNNIPFYIILGILGGFISLYFTRTLMWTEDKFRQINNPYFRLLAGGVVLSILIFIFPQLYGEGYNTIIAFLNGKKDIVFDNSIFYQLRGYEWVLLALLALLVLFKVFASAATTGSGGVGGIFAPSLFTGGVMGYFFARLINASGLYLLPETHFTLVGMAAIMAGVLHAPLTAIFLIAEITHGYELFVPLMMTSTISYLTIMYFEPHSIYTKQLARKGELLTHHKDKAVLTLMRLNKVLETDFLPVKSTDTLGTLVKTIAKAKRNLFPVIGSKGQLKGIVILDDIREIMFNHERYNDTVVEDLMQVPPAFIEINESMDSVMKKFEETGAWNLPVIENDKYMGFVSKSKIFSVYRRVLIHFSDE
ncbi:chloride channel protein [Plebeiibacterium sediminum]|uniref:Chloride channel protein n=1 Tax=Plebeiibacterium sediminum TaxID=2992112 RepID=A0AAE3M2Q8_9BACT|nr:chloride channel protein [Plebeiobacterium sediminum]MCW3785886.1 chloride channel protein [Plebeiobacterium sediminum]